MSHVTVLLCAVLASAVWGARGLCAGNTTSFSEAVPAHPVPGAELHVLHGDHGP